jgi:hypothetical protein
MRHVLALLFTAGLAACSDNQSFIGGSSYDASYIPGEHELYGPTIQTFVRGSPFPALPSDAARGAVLADMQEGGFPETKFTTDRVGRSPYRVLMVFAPTPGTGLQRLCDLDPSRLAALPAAPAGQRIGLAAVFCRADKLMGGADGTLPIATAANDPAVRGSIQAFMRQIFPATNPSVGRGG